MWQRAANDGHGDASYQLGVCYVKGIGGLAVNIDLGRSFIQAAAMQKNPSDKVDSKFPLNIVAFLELFAGIVDSLLITGPVTFGGELFDGWRL